MSFLTELQTVLVLALAVVGVVAAGVVVSAFEDCTLDGEGHC